MKRIIIASVCTLGVMLLGSFGNYQNSFTGSDKNIANAMENIQVIQQRLSIDGSIPAVADASDASCINQTSAVQAPVKQAAVFPYGNVDLTQCNSVADVVKELRNNGFQNITLNNINKAKGLEKVLAYVNENCAKPTKAPTVKPTKAPTVKPTKAPTVKPTKAPTVKPTKTPTVKPTAAPTAKPTTVPTSAADSSLNTYADQVLQLVNQERAQAGLSAITTNSTLSAAANKRAQEIVQTFSHTRPDGTSFYTVLQEYGISYRSAGENIAYGQRTPQEVMNGWMNSSGHRANILNSGYGKVGIGVYKVNGVIYWTQEFTN